MFIGLESTSSISQSPVVWSGVQRPSIVIDALMFAKYTASQLPEKLKFVDLSMSTGRFQAIEGSRMPPREGLAAAIVTFNSYLYRENCELQYG